MLDCRKLTEVVDDEQEAKSVGSACQHSAAVAAGVEAGIAAAVDSSLASHKQQLPPSDSLHCHLHHRATAAGQTRKNSATAGATAAEAATAT